MAQLQERVDALVKQALETASTSAAGAAGAPTGPGGESFLTRSSPLVPQGDGLQLAPMYCLNNIIPPTAGGLEPEQDAAHG